MTPDPSFWRGRRVLLTGHTGFKGAWAALWLRRMGADVCGLSLAPEGSPNLYDLLNPQTSADWCDLRNPQSVTACVQRAMPEIVLHMAAQSVVRRGYAAPVETFATNVQGTVNLLEALRETEGVKAVMVITSDKVYRNDGKGRAFQEEDPLGGKDPYSASKACAEHVTSAYAASFLEPKGVRVASARGGNVIGGGDFTVDRILPDIWRATSAGTPLQMRSPRSVRPWQHVLDCLAGYFVFTEQLVSNDEAPRHINIGPDIEDTLEVLPLAETFISAYGKTVPIEIDTSPQPPEAPMLRIDPRLAATCLGWRGRIDARKAARLAAEWYAGYDAGVAAQSLCIEQIESYANGEIG